MNISNSRKCHLAVLITVHNRKDRTLLCLENVFREHIQSYEKKVYLTDDGCTDGTPEEVRKRFPQVTIIHSDGTLFWNRGMRLAWETAAKDNADYYLWLNDDTVLMPDSVTRLLTCSKQLQDKSIVVGSTYASKENKTLSYGGRLKTHNNPFVIPDSEHAIECDTFNGNIVLIPRYVFEKVGFNDDFYHHGMGDIDYGIVAGLKGIKSFVAPDFYGYCERNNPIPLFRRKCYSLIERYKLLYSPWGYNPKEDFHLNRKYRPLWQCVLCFIKLHLNVLFTVDHTQYK